MISRKDFTELKNKDVELMVRVHFGHARIETYDDLLLYIQDEDKFDAKVNGVPLKQFLDWKAFYLEFGQCRGETKTGRRCRGRAATDPHSGATYFVAGVSDHCTVHGGRDTGRI